MYCDEVGNESYFVTVDDDLKIKRYSALLIYF